MRFVLLVSLCVIPILSQAQSSVTTTPSSGAVQDPQAVTVLNQVLTAGGGTQAISTVTDYTAKGTITYYPQQSGQVQGPVTVLGLNGIEFRMDATLPNGVRSYAVYQGIETTKSESEKIATFVPTTVAPSSNVAPYQTPLFPASIVFPVSAINAVVNSQQFNLSYNGVTQIDSHSVHDIVLQRYTPGTSAIKASISNARSRELFIDSTTFQIVAMRDKVARNGLREIHFSNYQNVNGVVMPFVISEYVTSINHASGQYVWTIQLSQITFNSGLQDSAFQIQ